MERLTPTNRRNGLSPHLLAACMFASSSRRRKVARPPLRGVLAQLAAEGLLS